MNNRIADYPLIALHKDSTGKYPFPNMPCGVLPFYIEDNKIIWGCVESNRVGVIAVAPPAGTQDIIVFKDHRSFVFEVAKPFPMTEFECLQAFTGKAFSGQTYQDIIETLQKNNFETYLENPIATAIHETREEHGTDLRKNVGKNVNLTHDLFEFEPQTILAKRGTTTQKVIVAFLNSKEGIELKETNKVEEKIPVNKGRIFYERGAWKTLDAIKLNFIAEKEKFSDINIQNDSLNKDQLELIRAELRAFESRIQLLEKIERSIVNQLLQTNPNLLSNTGAEFLRFTSINTAKKKEPSFSSLRLLSAISNPPPIEQTKEDERLEAIPISPRL
ncbi:MAG: hypothetical protein H0W64_11065 [Gammaproteobacteria bacterium]|nr:hypothetical protein [Gammaproteobacteria bacterium]